MTVEYKENTAASQRLHAHMLYTGCVIIAFSMKKTFDRVVAWWEKSSIVMKAVLLVIFPHAVATITTGCSFWDVFGRRRKEKTAIKKHVVRNIVIWSLALVWFYAFWLVILPFLVIIFIQALA